MPTPKSQLIPAAVLGIAVLGGAYYWFNLRETSDTGTQNLAAQNIEVSANGFFAQIKADNAANIHNFLLAGADPGTANDAGVTALMVAVQTENPAPVTQLLSALPHDRQAAANMLNAQESTGGKTALILAVEEGNADIVNLLIKAGADVRVSEKTSKTPLIEAVRSNHPELISPLIAADVRQHGAAALNDADGSGDTALNYAIRAKNGAMVDTLLAAKADAVTPDRSGVTALMIAAETGDEAIGEKLIAAGARLDTADRLGNTPLTIAIQHSHPSFARFLLGKGADPDFHTGGLTPLQAALAMQPFDNTLFTYLLSHSKQSGAMSAALLFDAFDHKNADLAKALLTADGGNINAKATNAAGETLLYHAIENDLEDAALMLLDKGADINQTGVSGLTPLERAVRRNEFRVVQKLLALGAPPDQKTAEGYTIAEMAVYSGYPEILDALLAKNAKLEKDFGILWAIRDGGGRSVPVLLKYGAHANVMSNNGDPALWLAAAAGETSAVASLIQYHAAIDFPNTAQGMTPLAAASHAGQLPVVKLLVEAGAKLETPDANGMTPLAHAAYMAKPDVVAYLIDKGANTKAADKQGRSITDLATLSQSSSDRDKVIALLQRKK